MRRVLVIFIAFSLFQALTSVDVTICQSWLFFAVLGFFAMTERRGAVLGLELMLWLRVLLTPALFFYWGSTVDVLAPGLACAVVLYALWTLQGRRRATFLVPLAVPLTAIAFIKFQMVPLFFPEALLNARLTGHLVVASAAGQPGWTRYHCAGYSIAVPVGMTSGFVGGQRSGSFLFTGTRPRGEQMTSMAMIYARETDFERDAEIQEMAAQVLGVACERDYARHVLNTADGHMFLIEKMAWLGLKPPEEIEELHLESAHGYLLSMTRANWYRARLYFDRKEREHQIDIWFYGEDPSADRNAPKLAKERVLQQLATFRIEPEMAPRPTLSDCLQLAANGDYLEQNIVLNGLLAQNEANFEALYLLGLNQRELGLVLKVNQIRNRLQSLLQHGSLAREAVSGWQSRYGSFGVLAAN